MSVVLTPPRLADPLVTVVIPAYNHAAFLRDAVLSVLNQTYTTTEIIVVDDGSTDDTLQVVMGLSPKVRYVSQPHQGIASARNRGLEMSSGSLIAFLDADDMFLPHKLEIQVDCLVRHAEAGMVYGSYVLIDREGRQIGAVTAKLSGNVYLGFLDRAMVGILATATVMVRKTVLAKVGLFDEAMTLAEDTDMWCRVASHYQVEAIAEPLARVRRHPGNVSGLTDPHLNCDMWLRILRKAAAEGPRIPWIPRRRLTAKAYLAAAIDLQQNHRDPLGAAQYLVRAWLHWPLVAGGLPAIVAVYALRPLQQILSRILPARPYTSIRSAWRRVAGTSTHESGDTK